MIIAFRSWLYKKIKGCCVVHFNDEVRGFIIASRLSKFGRMQTPQDEVSPRETKFIRTYKNI